MKIDFDNIMDMSLKELAQFGLQYVFLHSAWVYCKIKDKDSELTNGFVLHFNEGAVWELVAFDEEIIWARVQFFSDRQRVSNTYIRYPQEQMQMEFGITNPEDDVHHYPVSYNYLELSLRDFLNEEEGFDDDDLLDAIRHRIKHDYKTDPNGV